MRPYIELACEIRMRIGDFHVVDALWGVVEGDGKYRNPAQVVTADGVTDASRLAVFGLKR